MPDKVSNYGGISVVCPTYNSSAFIQRTIDSLLLQTELPEEIIFSDDGSSDDTINIIESSRTSFEQYSIVLQVIKNSHRGPGWTRNNGIANASQPWIAFLDSDDVWKKGKIYKIRKAIRENPASNCFLHWEEYVKINGDRYPLKHGFNNYNSDLALLPQLYQANFLSTSAVVCKKQLVGNGVGFDNTLPNAQDYELWLRISPKMNLTIIPEILGEYIEESTSITARPYYKRFWSEIRIAYRYRQYVHLSIFIKKFCRIILSKQWFYTFFNLLNNHQKHSN